MRRRTPPPTTASDALPNLHQPQSASRPFRTYDAPTSASKNRFFPELAAAALTPTRTTTATQNGSAHRPRAPSITSKSHDDENPFGPRSRVIGGERFPVRKIQAPAFPEEINPYNPKSRLVGDQTATNGNKPSPSSRYNGKTATKRSVMQNGQASNGKSYAASSYNDRNGSRYPNPSPRMTTKQNLPKLPKRKSSQPRISQGLEASPQVLKTKEPELPSTPSKRDTTSMRAKQRDLEELILSGGKSKRKPTKSNDQSPLTTSRRTKRNRVPIEQATTGGRGMTRKEEKQYQLLEARARRLRAEISAYEDELSATGDRKNEPLEVPDDDDLNNMIDQLLNLNNAAHSSQFINALAEHAAEPTQSKEVSNFLPRPVVDPLPQLSAFCPLNFTISNTMMLPSPDPSLLTKIQRKTFRGHSHESFLQFMVTMDVNTEPPVAVKELDVTVSPWAMPELGIYLQTIASERNISNTLYSISSYVTLARNRSLVWCGLEKKYIELLPSNSISKTSWKKDMFITADVRNNDKLISTGMLNRDNVGSDDNDEAGDDQPSRRQIMYFLPQQHMRFGKDTALGNTEKVGLQLLVSWLIKINCTGQACSEITASVIMPAHWADADSSHSAKKIPEMVNVLIKERGPFKGISAVLDLLADKF